MSKAEAFGRYRKHCPYRVEVEKPNRHPGGTALRIEWLDPADRCTARKPEHWGEDASALRWIASGGSPLVLGCCEHAHCPLRPNFCECGHRVLHLLRRPYYATAEEIGELFGKPMARHVARLAKAGRVRSKKLGSADQAGRLYRVADVLEWLEQDAETMDEVREDLEPKQEV